MLNFKYRILDKETKQLDELIVTSNCIWNYCVMLQRKHHEWYGQYISKKRLRQHIAKKRKTNSYWLRLNSQVVQEIVDRLDESCQRFFKRVQKRPPQFKKRFDDGSLKFTQSGYSVRNDVIVIKKIGNFKFLKHRGYPTNTMKGVRIKKHNYRYYVVITCDCVPASRTRDCNGTVRVAGIDFGLKTFITLNDGSTIESPRFLFKNAKKLRKLSKSLSRKQKNSNRRTKAKRLLARFHDKAANQRDAWQWEKAHILCKQYAVIKIEDICLTGMAKLWGRKISDIAIGEFVNKLIYVASKYGTEVVKIDRFYPSSHICNRCGHKLDRKLGLLEREWQCPNCDVQLDRDINAAINIQRWDANVQSVDRSETSIASKKQRRTTNKKPYASA